MALWRDISGELWVVEWTREPSLTLLQPPALELWLSMARLPCCPKLGCLSSASSAQAREMWLLMPSSQLQVQGILLARQVEWHHGKMHLRNDEVRRTAGQPHLSAIVQARRFSVFSHIVRMPDETDAKKILRASLLENWSRPPGRPHTMWMKTIIQQDLKSNNPSMNEAIVVAQNCSVSGDWCLCLALCILVVHVIKEEEYDVCSVISSCVNSNNCYIISWSCCYSVNIMSYMRGSTPATLQPQNFRIRVIDPRFILNNELWHKFLLGQYHLRSSSETCVEFWC